MTRWDDVRKAVSGGREERISAEGRRFPTKQGADATPPLAPMTEGMAFPPPTPPVERVVTPEDVGVRVDVWLSRTTGHSRAQIHRWCAEGLVLIDGRATRPSHRLRLGERVSATPPAPVKAVAVPEDIPLNIVYADDHLWVIDKPAGLVVHPAPGHWTGTLVHALLGYMARERGMNRDVDEAFAGAVIGGPGGSRTAMKAGPTDADDTEDAEDDASGEDTNAHCPTSHELAPTAAAHGITRADFGSSGGVGGVLRPGIVHRIDKDTSGLMVVSRSDPAHTGLQTMFRKHTVDRRYMAIVLGTPAVPEGTQRTPFGRMANDRVKRTGKSPVGTIREAITHYRVLESHPGASLVECRLETGRTHQIRVHMAEMGHPLVGDTLYGGEDSWRGVGEGRVRALLKAMGRHALHAATLGFLHPITGQRLHFQSPLPADMVRLLTGLRAISGWRSDPQAFSDTDTEAHANATDAQS